MRNIVPRNKNLNWDSSFRHPVPASRKSWNSACWGNEILSLQAFRQAQNAWVSESLQWDNGKEWGLIYLIPVSFLSSWEEKLKKIGIFNWKAFYIQLQQLEVLDLAPALEVPHKGSNRKYLDIHLNYYKLWVAVLTRDKMFSSINLYVRWSDLSCFHSKLPKAEKVTESSILNYLYMTS